MGVQPLRGNRETLKRVRACLCGRAWIRSCFVSPPDPTPAASAAARLAPASGAGVALGAFVTTPRAHQPPSWQLLEFCPDCELHPLSFQGLVGTEASSLRGSVGSFSEKPGAGE